MSAADGRERRFTEKAFYLREFSGRTLGIAVPDQRCSEHPELHRIIDELGDHGARVVLIVDGNVRATPERGDPLPQSTDHLAARAWRALRSRPAVVVRASGSLGTACLDVGRRLKLYKLVRVAPRGGLRGRDGRRRSFVDLQELRRLLQAEEGAAGEAALLREVEQLLSAGIPSVNVCTVEQLDAELFTYAGSGTLFTPRSYVTSRRLGIEDYDAAEDLIARGVDEGFLLARPEPAVDALLTEAFGAFVEGRLLAGIGALHVLPGTDGGEIASLYTLTRFAGGGIGGHLVQFAVAEARGLGLRFVYACTVFERVGAFFQRHGFTAVGADRVPADKWTGYDEARRAKVACFRRDL